MILLNFILLLIFVSFLPFQPFLATWSNSPIISILRDLFVIYFFLTALINRLKAKKSFIADEIDWAIVLFAAWFLISYLFISHNLIGLIYSLRYSFFVCLVFF